MQPTHKLTVAVSVYNTARYLEETFLCIENQSLGMENMEIILINDGSTDSSAEICRDFQKKHMENVCYVEFARNQGVRHAKNTALEMAKGSYITFWDSDDLWSLNAMEEAVAFLDMHEMEIDMVSCNIEYFESTSQPHVLNFDISEDMIIDIQKDYRKLRTAGTVCVIRTEEARRFRFDESQARWEDAKYINQLLLQKKKYGMLAGVRFYYRRRRHNDSATQTHRQDKRYYLHDLESFFYGVYEESMKQCGEFIPMMQYLTAYTLGYFFSEKTDILNKDEQCQYDAVRKKILSYIDVCYLKEIPNVDFLNRWKMLSFKYGLDMEGEIDQRRQKEREAQWNQTRIVRNSVNYNILKRWFTLKQQNKTVRTYFEQSGYQQIAIYGMSDLGKILLEELEGSSYVQVIYGIDKRAEKLTVGIPVLMPEDTLPETDVIVVTAIYYFREIDDLLRKKVTCPVVSLEDVLYTVE